MALREIIITEKQAKQIFPYTKNCGKKCEENVEECGQLVEDDEVTLDGGSTIESTKQAIEKGKNQGIKDFSVKTKIGESKKNKPTKKKLGESVTLTWKELLSQNF